MNSNMSYGYRSPSTFSSYSAPYSSTPSGLRGSPRSRFAYSGPSSYPRPRSSASKPNPDSFSDSMANNYGGSTSRMDSAFDSGNNFSSSYASPNNNSSYFSSNDSFYQRNKRDEDDYEQNVSTVYEDNNDIMDPKNGDYQEPKPFQNRFQTGTAGDFVPQRGGHFQSVANFQQPSNFQPPGPYPKFFGFQNTRRFRGNYKQKNFSARQFGKAKKTMENKKQWRCAVCSLDFTSQIPLDMHLRGAKHAKKMKSKQVGNSVAVKVKAPVAGNDSVPQAKELFCEVCNVQTNSSLQLQTHLDGNKHKNKLKGDAPKDEGETKSKTQFNGNGSITRSLPSDFGEPQPSKLTKFTCEICNVFMNSSTQLSQHVASKKHQAKVEGKPLQKGKKAKEATVG